jgi:arabinoxylan arabinofuranohydrolase
MLSNGKTSAFAACIAAASLFAANPIFTHKYTADPNPIVWNDRLYVFASQDDNNPADKGYNITAYTLMSSDDMANWTDHGEVFQVTRDMSWAKQAYAPGAAVRNNKVYLYVPDGGNSIGVAVADKPEGPFTDPLKKGLITKSMANCNVPWLFDPGAFVDDDGQAYLYFGGGDGESAGTNLRGIKLNNDMISVSGTAVTINAPCSFEAAYMHKHNGTYYFSYSTNFASCSPKGGNAWIDYLTSDNPLSGFARKGTIVPNGNIVGGGNNHAGTVLFKDKWYAFYHDRRARAANGLSAGEFRSVSVDVFTHNANGAINQATLTADGPPQIKNLNPYDTIRATTMNGQSGIKTALNSAEGMMLTSISDGNYIRLKAVDFGEGAASVSVRAASAANGGRIELRTGSATGTLIGTVNIASTGNWNTWQTFTADIENGAGVKDYLYLVFKGTGEPFRLSWYQFHGAEPEPSSSSSEPASSSSSSLESTPSSSSSELVPSSSSSEAVSSSSSEAVSPIITTSRLQLVAAHSLYYNLKGILLGTQKPAKPGVYIVKKGNEIQRIVVR